MLDLTDPTLADRLPGGPKPAGQGVLGKFRSLETGNRGTLDLAVQAPPPAAGAAAFFHAGEARIVLDDAVWPAVEGPAVAAPYEARFHLDLTAEGATLAEQAVPGAVIFELRGMFTAPGVAGRVTADLARVREALATGDAPISHERLAKAVAELIEAGAIRVEATAVEGFRRLPELVTELLRARLLRAAGPAGSAAPAGEGFAAALGTSRAVFTLTPDAGSGVTVWEIADGAELELVWTGSAYLTEIFGRPPGFDVREHDEDRDDEIAVQVMTNGLGHVPGLKEIAVRMEHRGRAEELVFHGDEERHTVVWPRDVFDEQTYTYSAEFRFDDGRVAREGPTQEFSRILVISAAGRFS